MIKFKNQLNWALSYFLFAAVLGVILRLFQVLEIPLNYKYIIHTHSHIALLGWVYIALTTLLYVLFVQQESLAKKNTMIFGFTQVTLLGMLFSFPVQGYALFSIIFSTLFLIASYWFVAFFFGNVSSGVKKKMSYSCIKWALWYMVLSSIGPWCLGIIMNTLGAVSIWYKTAIYFYLHFQYNGWMIFALLGLFVFILEKHEIEVDKRFFWMFNSGMILSFFLSTLWMKPANVFYVLGGTGALLQLLGFIILIKSVRKAFIRDIKIFSVRQKLVLKVLVVLVLVKMLLQVFSALPYFANLAVTYLDFTIGYLHWTFLGIISIGLFFFLDFFKLKHFSILFYSIYLLGFVLTEGLIFYKGIMGWLKGHIFEGYSTSLVIVSVIIPFALLLAFLKEKKLV